MSLHSVLLGIVDSDGLYTSPPGQVLDVTVIGGVAYLDVRDLAPDDSLAPVTRRGIRVPARSLIRALEMCIAEADDPEVKRAESTLNDETGLVIESMREKERKARAAAESASGPGPGPE